MWITHMSTGHMVQASWSTSLTTWIMSMRTSCWLCRQKEMATVLSLVLKTTINLKAYWATQSTVNSYRPPLSQYQLPPSPFKQSGCTFHISAQGQNPLWSWQPTKWTWPSYRRMAIATGKSDTLNLSKESFNNLGETCQGLLPYLCQHNLQSYQQDAVDT